MATISIVIPVYNARPYLEDCLSSLANQTFADIDVFCVDDFSTDGSFDFLEEFARKDHRFHALKSPEKGVGYARNAGIDAAKGDFLMFVDADDFIHPQTSETLLTVAKSGDADIVQCLSRRVPANAKAENFAPFDVNAVETAIREGALRRMLNKDDCPFGQKHDAWVNAVKKLYRRSVFKELRYDVRLAHEDDATFSLFAETMSKKTVWVNKELYFYRENPASVTRSLNINRYCSSAAARIPLWHERLMPVLPDDLKESLKKRQTNDAFRMMVKKPLKKGGAKELLEQMRRALAEDEEKNMIDRRFLSFGDKIVFAAFVRGRFAFAKTLSRLGL